MKPESKRVVDSPMGWVKKHIDDYVQSDGRSGHSWRGYPTLLLTTRGRKTRKLRRTALIYGMDGTKYVLVTSNGGSQTHPMWYLNLVADPNVELQVRAETFAGRARTASPEERVRLWKMMAAVFPRYDDYQQMAAREIPVVVVERV